MSEPQSTPKPPKQPEPFDAAGFLLSLAVSVSCWCVFGALAYTDRFSRNEAALDAAVGFGFFVFIVYCISLGVAHAHLNYHPALPVSNSAAFSTGLLGSSAVLALGLLLSNAQLAMSQVLFLAMGAQYAGCAVEYTTGFFTGVIQRLAGSASAVTRPPAYRD